MGLHVAARKSSTIIHPSIRSFNIPPEHLTVVRVPGVGISALPGLGEFEPDVSSRSNGIYVDVILEHGGV